MTAGQVEAGVSATAGTPQPRIDIVVVRDPDYANDVTVYVNGEPATDLHHWSFDPGAGYTYEDYMQMRVDDVKSAPGFLKDTIEQLYENMRGAFSRWGFDWTTKQRTGEADEAYLAEIAQEEGEPSGRQ